MADPHSTRDCATCGKSFPVKKGPGRKPIYCGFECRPSIRKPCAWCGTAMTLMPAAAKKQDCCDRKCSALLRSHRVASSRKAAHCHGCHKPFARRSNPSRDSGKYCSRECAFSVLAIVSAERKALHRIGDRQRMKERLREERIAPEVDALRRIGGRIRERTRECAGCGKTHVRRWAFSRFCSDECRQGQIDRTKAKYRGSDAWRAGRRRYKSKRRALIRNAPRVDSIDPIEVFERDKWRCHICGEKTHRRLRGTLDDRAPELEHIVSLADGGTHTWGNVACSCRKCNQDKGAESFGQLGLSIM